MGDLLAAELYAEWRSTQDPTVAPAWGNADQETRESWERVATRARRTMAQRFVASIDRETEFDHEPDVSLANVRSRWSR